MPLSVIQMPGAVGRRFEREVYRSQEKDDVRWTLPLMHLWDTEGNVKLWSEVVYG